MWPVLTSGCSSQTFVLKSWARDLEQMLRAKHAISHGPKAAAEMLRERSRMFFAALPLGSEGRAQFTRREEFLEEQGELYLGVLKRAEPAGGRT